MSSRAGYKSIIAQTLQAGFIVSAQIENDLSVSESSMEGEISTQARQKAVLRFYVNEDGRITSRKLYE